jgi:S-(hydroxymethyl)glutathione dehydrogenase/alcohol dehydrogenase
LPESWRPLSVEEVDLAGPRAGEVLVEIKATGVCHTDYYTLSGADPEGIFPAILGHEGAGIVTEVGHGVTSLKPGDHVIPLYTPECRQCKFCLSQKTNLCQSIRATQGKGLMPDGTARFSIDGTPIFHYMGTSTFANHIVVPEIALAKIRPDAFRQGLLYRLRRDDRCRRSAVHGQGGGRCERGGIWFGRDRAERYSGSQDGRRQQDHWGRLEPGREAMARKFGMTHFVNPRDVENVVDHIIQLTDGGADYSFECIGNTKVMRQALECCHKGWGKSIVIGVAEAGAEISTRPFQLVTGREWKALHSVALVVGRMCRRSSTGTWKGN